MIKAEVTITGTVRRSASIRTDRNNQPYVSFLMSVSLADGTGTKDISVFVSLPQAQQSDLSLYTEGQRVTASGTMDIRRKDDALSFYLTARLVTVENVSALDAISGTLSFRGYLKKENIFEERTSKNGRPYLLFSAYSSEKAGDSFVSTGHLHALSGEERHHREYHTRMAAPACPCGHHRRPAHLLLQGCSQSLVHRP